MLLTQSIKHKVFHLQREKQRDGKSNHTLANLNYIPSVSWSHVCLHLCIEGLKKEKYCLELLLLYTQTMMRAHLIQIFGVNKNYQHWPMDGSTVECFDATGRSLYQGRT